MSATPANGPRLIASVMVDAHPDEDGAALVRSAAAAGADTIELRLDNATRAGASRLIETAHEAGCQVIATCRRISDGGAWDGTEPDRISLLLSAEAAGADRLDVEHDSGALAELSTPARRPRLIVSLHDTVGTPADLPGIAGRLQARGCGMAKLVTTARSLGEALAVRELLRRMPAGGAPLIAFAMGPRGIHTRVLALAWGSAAAYFAADPRAPAAPGQIDLEEAVGVYDVEGIGADTALYGITGSPLGHTLSPRLHNAAFSACGIDARYVPFETDRYGDFLETATALDLAGFSVTVPHKIEAAREADELDEAARAIGAVNTVLRRIPPETARQQEPSPGSSEVRVRSPRPGVAGAASPRARLIGANTDARAGVAVLLKRVQLKGARVLLLGAGGAARALAFGLIGEGADLHVFDRTPGRAGELTHALGGTPVGPDDLPGLCPDILVNATSAGMEDPEQLPLPSAAIAGRLVFDLVYGRRRTRLLHEAEARGIECMDGREMLLEQALLQFGLWTGLRGEALDLPRSAMAAAMPEGGRY